MLIPEPYFFHRTIIKFFKALADSSDRLKDFRKFDLINPNAMSHIGFSKKNSPATSFFETSREIKKQKTWLSDFFRGHTYLSAVDFFVLIILKMYFDRRKNKKLIVSLPLLLIMPYIGSPDIMRELGRNYLSSDEDVLKFSHLTHQAKRQVKTANKPKKANKK